MAKQATAELQRDVRHPELQAALQEGTKTSEQWARRIDKAVAETGSTEDTGNPILEAHFEVGRKIRQTAQDDMSRDLGIIAADRQHTALAEKMLG